MRYANRDGTAWPWPRCQREEQAGRGDRQTAGRHTGCRSGVGDCFVSGIRSGELVNRWSSSQRPVWPWIWAAGRGVSRESYPAAPGLRIPLPMKPMKSNAAGGAVRLTKVAGKPSAQPPCFLSWTVTIIISMQAVAFATRFRFKAHIGEQGFWLFF